MHVLITSLMAPLFLGLRPGAQFAAGISVLPALAVMNQAKRLIGTREDLHEITVRKPSLADRGAACRLCVQQWWQIEPGKSSRWFRVVGRGDSDRWNFE
jgi:hypothetical protein